jgi:hypothetical protein
MRPSDWCPQADARSRRSPLPIVRCSRSGVGHHDVETSQPVYGLVNCRTNRDEAADADTQAREILSTAIGYAYWWIVEPDFDLPTELTRWAERLEARMRSPTGSVEAI